MREVGFSTTIGFLFWYGRRASGPDEREAVRADSFGELRGKESLPFAVPVEVPAGVPRHQIRSIYAGVRDKFEIKLTSVSRVIEFFGQDGGGVVAGMCQSNAR